MRLGATVKTKLTKTKVKNWLRGQKISSRFVERERARRLLRLTPEQAATMYLSFGDSNINGRQSTQPSPLLWAMRKVLKRYSATLGRCRI